MIHRLIIQVKINFKEGQGISARGDLNSMPMFAGGIDFKIVNSNMVNNLQILTKCGPSHENNPNLKIFNFLDFKNYPISKYHFGAPDRFNFKSFIFKDLDED